MAKMSRYVKDLTGKRFGRLAVVSYLRTSKNNNSLWLCKCKCGNKKENCVPCCLICNRAKSNMNLEDFLEWVDRIAAYNASRKETQ